MLGSADRTTTSTDGACCSRSAPRAERRVLAPRVPLREPRRNVPLLAERRDRKGDDGAVVEGPRLGRGIALVALVPFVALVALGPLEACRSSRPGRPDGALRSS